MNTEQRGQYYFAPDIDGNFKIQEKPLGILIPQDSQGTVTEGDKKSSWFQRLGEKISLLLKIPETVEPQAPSRFEDFEWDPGTYPEMKVLHDVLLADLEEKGILNVIERLTNVPQEEWWDHENPPNYNIPAKKSANTWDVDISGPGFDYYERPNPYGNRWNGNCTQISSVPQKHMTIGLIIGEEWDERYVAIKYDRRRNLTIEGEETSEINLDEGDWRYVFGEHLRDAMNNPYNPYYVTEGGFLSPAAFRRHQHELNIAREKEYTAA